MNDLSDARIKSMNERCEALKKWADDDSLELPEKVRETMRLVSDDIADLLKGANHERDDRDGKDRKDDPTGTKRKG